ncbi:DUF5709 domain-containing protein [Embleya sp. NPDC059237]|uniref:DUF5709 domain-containing protein n=1 Tax=Embleya sp. NPDC059237 TaxID=3346784 RepID=UPI0036B87827
MSDDIRGDDVYQPANADIDNGPDDELDLENAVDEPDLDELLDAGYSPPERPFGVEEFGTTTREQTTGESLDRRLTRERPDVEPEPGDGIGDLPGATGEVVDGQVGGPRTGRLTQDDNPNRDHVALAEDVGIDGGAASAEEAAVHTVPDDPDEA